MRSEQQPTYTSDLVGTDVVSLGGRRYSGDVTSLQVVASAPVLQHESLPLTDEQARRNYVDNDMCG